VGPSSRPGSGGAAAGASARLAAPRRAEGSMSARAAGTREASARGSPLAGGGAASKGLAREDEAPGAVDHWPSPSRVSSMLDSRSIDPGRCAACPGEGRAHGESAAANRTPAACNTDAGSSQRAMPSPLEDRRPCAMRAAYHGPCTTANGRGLGWPTPCAEARNHRSGRVVTPWCHGRARGLERSCRRSVRRGLMGGGST